MLLRSLIFIFNVLVLPILFFAEVDSVWGESRFNVPVQLSTHPGEDFAPALSPDGKRMVYVSDRSGNLDIWLKYRGPGVHPPDRRLTVHSAEDNSPSFGPKSGRIVFISHRSDPKGDIYLLEPEKAVPGGEEASLVRLTEVDSPEQDPVWSPDEKFIYFVSTNPDSRKRGIFKLDPETRSRSLVVENGVNPAVSPDGKRLAFVASEGEQGLWVVNIENGTRTQVTAGRNIEAYPAWSQTGERIFFTRYQDDTDFDGDVSINDNPSIWSVEFHSGQPGTLRQLTDSSTYDLLPASTVGNALVFTSNRKNSIDIWELPGEGLLPRGENYGLSLQVVADLCSGKEGDSYRCLMAFSNLIHEFGKEDGIARIRYKLARGYKNLGHLETAYRLFEAIVQNHPDEKEYRGLAEIDLLLLDLNRSRQQGQTIYKKKLEEGIGFLETLSGRYKDSPHIAARAYMEMGNLHLKLDNQSRALGLYKKVINEYPGQRFLSAGAAFSQSKIYSLVGDQTQLVQAFVQVVQDYYDVDQWSENAVQEILNIYEKQPTLEKKVSSLQVLTEKYKGLPRLAASIQNRIGELFYKASENLLAKEAYRKTADQYPEAASEVFKAKVALANIYSEEENFEKSLEIYEGISGNSAFLEEDLKKARTGYIQKFVAKGNWELKVGEVKLALKTFLKLIDFSPETVEAHRGYVEANALLKKTGKAIQFYQDRLRGREKSAVDHYALGLAHTYLSPPELDKAEDAIGRALALDSQQAYFHQTLGWIFEQKEARIKGEDYLERSVAEYQMALALNDATGDPDNEANLLLNLGNGHYLLSNYYSAYHYYNRRSAKPVKFFDPGRESIFHQRFGESAFKSVFPEVAVAQYQKALKIVSEKNQLNRMAELNDRIALVYQYNGDHAKAVEYFSRTLELNREAGNEVSLSRSLRNIANNLFMLTEEQEEPDPESLNLALNHYFKAIENLEEFGVVQRGKKKKKDALIGVEVQTGLGEDVSGAASGFDVKGEQKLIFHYIGKIYGDFREYGKAVEYFEKKLALIPENLDVKKNIPVLLEKALLQNQIGNFLFHDGKYDASLQYFRDSYQLSRQLNNKYGVAVNAANIGRAVFTKSQFLSFTSMQAEIENTIGLLEETVTQMGPFEESPNPEYFIIVKNYLGVFYHTLVYGGSNFETVKASSEKEKVLKSLVLTSTRALKEDFARVQKSLDHFEEALALVRQSKKPFPGMESALMQNLQLAEGLAGKRRVAKPNEMPTQTAPAEHLKWQYKYLESLIADPSRRLELLLQAEEMLTRLPYGVVPNDPSALSMVEDLYQGITRLLFQQEKLEESLMFSEKGREQLLVLLRPHLDFADEDRKNYYDELTSYAERFRAAALAEKEGKAEELEQGTEELIEEYQEVLGALQDENPALASLFAPNVPIIEEIQDLLRPGQVLLKYEQVYDGILIWQVDADSVQGHRVKSSAELVQLISRLGREGEEAKAADIRILSNSLLAPVQNFIDKSATVVILAGGSLEFLPWAAMQAGNRALVEIAPMAFISSLSQFRSAEAEKNLFNSRFLGVDVAGFDKVAPNFASAENLTGEQANLEPFQKQWPHYGVVHVDSRTHLGHLNPADSYISIGQRQNQFQRVSMRDLFVQPVEANFIALSQVIPEFHPELRLSPTAQLLQALTLKGYPGILLRTGAFDPVIHAELMQLFYQSFRKGKPADSLRQAQIEVAKRHPKSLAFAGYRFYGFPGMEEEEKNAFAEAHFMQNAQNGAKAFVGQDWLGTIDHLEKSLALMDFLPDKSLTERIYKTLAQAAYNRGDYAKAIQYQEDLLVLAKKSEDPEQLAEALYFLGILYSRAEQFPTAVGHLRNALAIYEKNEILDRLAESYSTLGIVEENALDFDQALEAFSSSLKINEEIGEDLNRGRELRRIGRIYYLRLNQYPQARKYFEEAYKLFAELGEKEQLVETLLELGLVAEKQGDFTQALESYQKAQVLAAENDLKQGLSKAHLYQANSYWYQGDYQKAFRYQKEALEIAEAIEDQRQQTFIYNTLGLIYWTLNDSTRALNNLKRSLELAEAIQSPLDVASANNNIGLVYRKDKNYVKSIEYFNRALEKDIELKSKWGQGYTHRNLGMSFMRMGKLDEAETHIVQAIELSQQIGNQTNLVKSMLESGHLAIERKDCVKAVPIFQETRKLAAKLNIAEVHWRALRGEGFCLAKADRLAEAAEVYKQAVAVVDRMRAAIKVEEFQNGFLTDKQDVYKELILVLLNLGKVEESFNFAERAKSRSFIDLLGNQKINLKDDVSQKLYNALTDQKQKIRSFEEALGVARTGEDEAAIKQASANLVQARNQYQDLLIQAKQESPEISNFVTVESITLKELDQLLEPEVALVEYLVTDEELVAWVVRKGGIEVVRTAVKEKDLNALIQDYRKRMQQLAPLEEQSEALYSLLIAPVDKRVADKRVLGIIPNGFLHYISFASLKNKESYLVEKHPLFYSPSASVLKYTFARKVERSGPVKVLALGNPDLGDFNYDLPLAEMEAKAIKWDFPQIDVLTREKATESWLKEHIGDYQIIHIASHGEFDPINPLFSSLKLTKDQKADGNFEVNEVFSLNINTDIVTLSACQTGLGEITGGDELVGLNRAFIYAGTHALLSSLWRVSDISTAILIKHFYRNYAENNKSESLRKAQLLVKKSYPHPSYWAGFNLTGDYR